MLNRLHGALKGRSSTIAHCIREFFSNPLFQRPPTELARVFGSLKIDLTARYRLGRIFTAKPRNGDGGRCFHRVLLDFGPGFGIGPPGMRGLLLGR